MTAPHSRHIGTLLDGASKRAWSYPASPDSRESPKSEWVCDEPFQVSQVSSSPGFSLRCVGFSSSLEDTWGDTWDTWGDTWSSSASSVFPCGDAELDAWDAWDASLPSCSVRSMRS